MWLQEEPLWKKKGRQQGRFFPVYTFLPTYIASPNISQPTGVINIHEIACLSSSKYIFFSFYIGIVAIYSSHLSKYLHFFIHSSYQESCNMFQIFLHDILTTYLDEKFQPVWNDHSLFLRCHSKDSVSYLN